MMRGVDDFLNKASVQGLRTLLMAVKIVDQAELKQLMQDIAKAEKNLETREEALKDIFDKFERDLVLLGATAVEDRLQDNVPETIHDLQEAGIRIWMLTGDKLETAENIGFSCKLLKNDMIVWRMSSPEEVADICSMAKVQENIQLQLSGTKRGLIVEAKALSVILSDIQYKKNFIKIAKSCEAVICCRVSPSQKADVVRLIK
jgi:magnesium-transporting ATPase (P-type)